MNIEIYRLDLTNVNVLAHVSAKRSDRFSEICAVLRDAGGREIASGLFAFDPTANITAERIKTLIKQLNDGESVQLVSLNGTQSGHILAAEKRSGGIRADSNE